MARMRRMGVFGNDDGNAGAGPGDMAVVALPPRADPAVGEMRVPGHVDPGVGVALLPVAAVAGPSSSADSGTVRLRARPG
jgi:hypothetical protein